MSVKFMDPPPDGRGNNAKYVAVRAELQANPRKWALIEGCNSPSALKQWKHLGFEVTSRRRTDGPGYDVYARYLGTEP